jgi:glucose/arabinose dehydrogenase
MTSFPFRLLRFLVPAAILVLTLEVIGFRAPERSQAAPDVLLQSLATGVGPITSIVSAGDNRLFLTIQTGRIVVWDGARILPSAFLDLTSLVSCCGERGLLSIAFHPQYAANGRFFVNYTNRAGDTVVARYLVSASDPNAADPASGVTLLTIRQPFENHNGGELQFGPDGYLYIGMGDGGSANDPMCNAQRDDTLLGKLLRIDVDQNVNSSPFYGIPPDNPFRPSGVANEVWAKGLRNPWRFSFDRATGDLWIGDVGQDSREEVDLEPAGSGGGKNYGWKVMEGTICGGGGTSGCPSPPPPCNSTAYVRPVFEYDHSSGSCSITGGYVYRGSAMPAFVGMYFYGDYCSGRLFANQTLLTPRPTSLTSFGQDTAGELYLGTGNGGFFRIAQAGAPAATPTPVSTMTPTAVPTGTPTPGVTPPSPPPDVTRMAPVPGGRGRPPGRVVERSAI